MKKMFNPYQFNPYAIQYQPQSQMQNQQQPQVQPQMAMPNRTQNESGIIWVNGLTEAENYLVAPNSAIQLWDRNGKAVYLKSADQTGLNKIKIYDLVERIEPKESDLSNAKEFALKEDLNALQSKYDDLKGIVDDLTAKKTKKEVAKDE